jgi:hypothetical protein
MPRQKRETAEPLTGGNGAADLALSLAQTHLVFRNHGLEFHSRHPLPLWAEVQVDVHPPGAPEPLRSNGVVVDCSGSRDLGYTVALFLLDLPAHARRYWDQLVQSA